MIKGQAIENLMQIQDSRTGSIILWIMLIMMLGIYILYNITYNIWITVTVKKLKKYETLLRKGNKQNKRNHSEVALQVQKKRIERTKEEEDDLKIYNSLKLK